MFTFVFAFVMTCWFLDIGGDGVAFAMTVPAALLANFPILKYLQKQKAKSITIIINISNTKNLFAISIDVEVVSVEVVAVLVVKGVKVVVVVSVNFSIKTLKSLFFYWHCSF